MPGVPTNCIHAKSIEKVTVPSFVQPRPAPDRICACALCAPLTTLPDRVGAGDSWYFYILGPRCSIVSFQTFFGGNRMRRPTTFLSAALLAGT